MWVTELTATSLRVVFADEFDRDVWLCRELDEMTDVEYICKRRVNVGTAMTDTESADRSPYWPTGGSRTRVQCRFVGVQSLQLGLNYSLPSCHAKGAGMRRMSRKYNIERAEVGAFGGESEGKSDSEFNLVALGVST